jgi:hemin uptake protein HemP
MSATPFTASLRTRAELPAASSLTSPESGLPCLRSKELFDRTREILIEHQGAYYRLRLTHSNKLILTK